MAELRAVEVTIGSLDSLGVAEFRRDVALPADAAAETMRHYTIRGEVNIARSGFPESKRRPDGRAAPILLLKDGCRVRCTRNLYTRGAKFEDSVGPPDVANGATGTLCFGWSVEGAAVDDGSSGGQSPSRPPSVERVYVEWDHLQVEGSPAVRTLLERALYRRRAILQLGEEARVHMGRLVRFKKWVRLDYVREQLPLAVCYAKNVYHAQGCTITTPLDLNLTNTKHPAGVTDEHCPHSAVTPEGLVSTAGLLYTAMSRVDSLKRVRFITFYKPYNVRRDHSLGGLALDELDVFVHPLAAGFYGALEKCDMLALWI
jgi:hypothetical protein